MSPSSLANPLAKIGRLSELLRRDLALSTGLKNPREITPGLANEYMFGWLSDTAIAWGFNYQLFSVNLGDYFSGTEGSNSTIFYMILY